MSRAQTILWLGFAGVMFISVTACQLLAPPSQAGSTLPPPNQSITALPTSRTLMGWVTFSDENDSYTLDIPPDWLIRHSSGKDYYADQFQPPDLKELVEVFVFDDGKPFSSDDDKLIFALSVLHSLYAENAEATNRVIESEYRERITWQSKVTNTTGTSIFEVRNQTIFVMLTILGHSNEEPYPKVINTIMENFSVP